jgi:hypothetical protein
MSIDPGTISNQSAGSAAGAVGVSVLKKAVDSQANAVLQLLQSTVIPPSVASSGSVGTQLNQYA